MALTQPVWSRIDEAPNADFIVQLSHGVYPVADATPIAPETMAVLRDEGFFSPLHPSAYGEVDGPPPDPTDRDPIPPGLSDRANAVWMSRHIWTLSRESDQTPIYYLAMAPVWWTADRIGGTYAAIYVIRVLGALIVATLAPMAVALARMIAPARPEIAALAAVFAVLLPGLDLNGPRISNDGLAAALGGVFVLLAVCHAGTRWTWRRALLMGLVLGLGLMTKLTLAGLFPALVVSASWPAPGTRWRSRLAWLAVSGAVAVACLVPWFLLNLHLYGELTPGVHATRLQDGLPGSLTPTYVGADLATFLVTWWSGEPWGTLPLALAFVVLGVLLALTAPVALVNLWTGRSPGEVKGRLAVIAAAVVGMMLAALSLPATTRFAFEGHGRFAYAAAAGAAVLWALGLSAVLKSAPVRRAVAALYAVVVVVMLGASAASYHAAPLPSPGPGAPPAGAAMTSVSASGRLQSVTISVDEVALDAAGRVTWFEVTVDNASSVEVDWPGVPDVSMDGRPVTVDYLRSTHMPGDVDPGRTITGWVRVAIDPAAVHPGDHALLRFQDVAVDTYRTVEDVEVSVAL